MEPGGDSSGATPLTTYIYIYVYTYIYIYRVKAEGSPEANCIFFVWIWKMLFLHCILQCFMLFSEIVRSAQVDVCPRRKKRHLHLRWMAKHACNILTIGIAVSCVFGRFVDN